MNGIVYGNENFKFSHPPLVYFQNIFHNFDNLWICVKINSEFGTYLMFK